MSALPILNAFDGPAEWSPVDFIGSSDKGVAKPMHGIARRCFAVMCPEANGFKRAPEMAKRDRHVMVIHLPTGKHLATCRHGSHAFAVADTLLERFPEFDARPFDLGACIAIQQDVYVTLSELGAIG